MTLDSAWWTAVGTCFAAIGTVAVAVWLLVYQVRDRQGRRAAQARQVAVWIDDYDPTREPLALLVRVYNGSQQPIFRVSIQVPVGVRGTFVRGGTLTMAPGETREWTIELPGHPRSDFLGATVMFQDAASVMWSRGSGGDPFEPSEAQQTELLREDPGAWDSIEGHPTMGTVHDDPTAWSGRKVTD